MSKRNRLNYRSTYQIVDEVELLPVEIIGSSRIERTGNEYYHSIPFDDFKAKEVHLRDDEMLDNLKADRSIKTVGNVRTIKYTNIDKITAQL